MNSRDTLVYIGNDIARDNWPPTLVGVCCGQFDSSQVARYKTSTILFPNPRDAYVYA